MICGGRDDKNRRKTSLPAEWIARAKVNDPEQYKKYTNRVPAILQKFRGQFLARGGDYKILEGPENFERLVVIESPSTKDAVACHDSAEYEEASAFRKGGGVRWNS